MYAAQDSLSAAPLPNMSIEMTRSDSGPEWLLRAVSFRTSKGIVRHILQEATGIALALNDRLAQFVEENLSGASEPAVKVFSDDFSLNDGTMLRKFRFIISQKTDGALRATVNVFQVIGSISSAFSPDYRSALGIEDFTHRMAAKALSDLINPCLDLLVAPLAHRNPVVDEHIGHRLDRLSDVQEELSFWARMLTRFAAVPPMQLPTPQASRAIANYESAPNLADEWPYPNGKPRPDGEPFKLR